MKGGRGGGAYLQELESLEAIAGDDIDVPRVTIEFGSFLPVLIATAGSRWLRGAPRSSNLSPLKSASASTSNRDRDDESALNQSRAGDDGPSPPRQWGLHRLR